MRYPVPPSPGSLAEAPVAVPDVPPSERWSVLLRLAIALGLVAGLVHLAFTPLHRPLDDLFSALATGDVTTVTIERPSSGGEVMGSFRVDWDGGWRPAYSTYEYSTYGSSTSSYPTYDDATGEYSQTDSLSEGPGPVDEGEMIIRAAEQSSTDVEVIVQPATPPTSGFYWSPGGTAFLAALLLLVGGRQPRLATKWAWFWLFVHVPPAAFAFVLLEPTRLWRNAPQPARPKRLTGGWAFLLGFLLAGVLAAMLPGYAEYFPE